MGELMSKPVVEKHSNTQITDDYFLVCTSMQGYRVTMEDAHQFQLHNKKKTSLC